jgi:uncharacterized membrane protein YidH (DUF202 family)
MDRDMTGTSARCDPVVLEAGRTALAWTRTALALVVNAAVIVCAGVNESRTELVTLGLVPAAASIAAVDPGGLAAPTARRRAACAP